MSHLIKMVGILALTPLEPSVKEGFLSDIVFEAQVNIHYLARVYIIEEDQENPDKVKKLEVGTNNIAYRNLTEIPCEDFSDALIGFYSQLCDGLKFIIDEDFQNLLSKSSKEAVNTLTIAKEIMEGSKLCLELDKSKTKTNAEKQSDCQNSSEKDNTTDEQEKIKSFINDFFLYMMTHKNNEENKKSESSDLN